MGPFDLAAIPIGAYKPRFLNKEAHVNPAEAVTIHSQLRSKQSVAIHWGTFPLSEEELEIARSTPSSFAPLYWNEYYVDDT